MLTTDDQAQVCLRVCTSFLPENVILPSDVASHRDYPGRLVMKLIRSRLAMLFRFA